MCWWCSLALPMLYVYMLYMHIHINAHIHLPRCASVCELRDLFFLSLAMVCTFGFSHTADLCWFNTLMFLKLWEVTAEWQTCRFAHTFSFSFSIAFNTSKMRGKKYVANCNIKHKYEYGKIEEDFTKKKQATSISVAFSSSQRLHAWVRVYVCVCVTSSILAQRHNNSQRTEFRGIQLEWNWFKHHRKIEWKRMQWNKTKISPLKFWLLW